MSVAEVERWFKYRDNRNSTAHDYGEGFAKETLTLLPDFITDIKALAQQLEAKQAKTATMPKLDPSALHLPERFRQILLPLLRQHVPQAQVWAYGSRVTRDYYEASDLDLVLRNPHDLNQPSDGILDLQEALVESDIPIQVQVVDWARIPLTFHAEIEAGYVVLE